ncbi:MAG TPA: chromate efflux transporter [Acidimicrobiales bacterium]|nr:chromate efflux transporter [Acidimicrobiales bacterium]
MGRRRPLAEVAAVFFKLGLIGFGGPAVHVAMMRDEVVVRRRWVEDRDFVDGLGVTSVLPGPGSTQMSMLLGRARAGPAGLVVAGVCFVAPAMAIVLGLAWAYTRYGRSTWGAGVLYGIRPVVIAMVAQALYGLGRVAVRGPLAWALAGGAFVAYLAGIDVLVILLGAGAVLGLARRTAAPGAGGLAAVVAPAPILLVAGDTLRRVRPGPVFLEFLKLGVVVFGSGYVLLAYLRHDLVGTLGWIGPGRLLDAVAVGQLTPGPVFTTATFIGYLVGGFPGGLVATAGIFLPSFAMVAMSAPLIGLLRRRPWSAAVLDGVNAAALGLLAGVGIDLARSALTGWLPAVLALTAAALVGRRVNMAWVVAAGAVAGVIHAVA